MESGLQKVEGFNAIIAAPNECAFASQRRGVDYRGPSPGHWTGAWWVPEELEKNELLWETATCPEKCDTLFSFVAASATTPPDFARGPQARLHVNDEYALTFDLGIGRDRTWKLGEWELSYASKYVQWPFDGYDRRFEMMGNSGLYSLKVPARATASGQPCRIKVEILPFPRWPRTWFMIKERRDTLQENHTSEEVTQLRVEVNQLKQLVHILATVQYSAALGREALQHQVVYSDGYRHLLSPDLARLSNGDWLLCFRIGAEHTSLDGDVLILRSHDEGHTWGEVNAAAATPDLDEREGGIVELPDGRLLMNIFINRLYDDAGRYLDTAQLDHGALNMYTILSSDGGRTWSEPRYLDLTGLPFTDIEGPASPPILLTDGTALQVLTAYNINGNPQGSATVLFSSHDGGEWELRSIVAVDADGKIGGFWEGSIVRADSGRLIVAMRNEGAAQVIWTAISADEGHTWSSPQPSPMVGHPPDLIRLQNGAILCTYGYRPEFHGEPAGIRATLSYDEGQTWDSDNEIILRQDFTNFDIGYPASLQRNDGKIVTVYYYNMFGRFYLGSTTWELPNP